MEISYAISCAAILMWFKFTYFLRINESTGYLIRMLFEVFKDMSAFMIIFCVTIIAFSDAFYTISNSQATQGQTQFIKSYPQALFYTYLLTLGEFNLEDENGDEVYATFVPYVFFMLCSIFNLIIMLNLLIAIISDTFARVKSSSILTAY